MALLIVAAGSVAAWYSGNYFLHAYGNRESPTNASATGNSAPQAAPWTQDVLDAFDDAAQQAKSGNIAGAEVQVDEAVAAMEEARVRSKAVPGDFFSRSSTELHRILTAQPESESAVENSGATGPPQEAQEAPPDSLVARLFQHVTQARIELAAIRSWQERVPAHAGLAVDLAETAVQGSAAKAGSDSAAAADVTSAPSALASGGLKLPAGHVDIEAPRNLKKGEALDPASLHATFLDASLMPDTSEILLPPESRQLADDVRVENLTIAGASQTLDGVHWRNVTFIATRLRYEDGPLSLNNVRFVHCTFGFPPDARGAAIANMIALGKTSLTIK
jgi:hypothetical protein